MDFKYFNKKDFQISFPKRYTARKIAVKSNI